MYDLNNGELAPEKKSRISIHKIRSNDYCTVLLDLDDKKIILFLNGKEISKRDLKLKGEFQPCIDVSKQTEFTIINI
jgi:hypothetical protein